jgi:hypothetical protein
VGLLSLSVSELKYNPFPKKKSIMDFFLLFVTPVILFSFFARVSGILADVACQNVLDHLVAGWGLGYCRCPGGTVHQWYVFLPRFAFLVSFADC